MDKNYGNLMVEKPELFVNLPGGLEVITNAEHILQVERTFQTKLGIIYEDEYLILLKDAVRFPDDTVAPYIRAYHKHPGGVAVFVVNDGKILLIKHFRHSLRTWVWETPRGFCEENQSPTENALRELNEELGVFPISIDILGEVIPDAGIIGERITLFYAIIDSSDDMILEQHEGIKERRFFTKQEFKEAIVSGEIKDGITIASFTYAELKGLI